MITIIIRYQGANGSALNFAREMMASGIVSEIRAEEGNLRYEYLCPVEDEETVVLIDSWEDQEALDLHHRSPLMGRIASLREQYDLHMEVQKYAPILNDGDEKYIRK
ncbi:MAG: antibiotic biosynthesis monooxygenase [Bacilli bacterium]|nr:antibiotic biosynthesis monooxygenase [Bacilli bacterium]